MNERGSTLSTAGPLGGQSGQPLVEQTKQKAAEVVNQARQQIRSQLADKKDSAAEGLGQVAEALRQTGQQLSDHQQGSFSQYAQMAADQVERFSGYLREQDIERLVGEVESLARRQPALFVGSAFMLGFFLSRFLKSSSDGAAAGSGARPAWDRATWERSTWSNTPAAMPGSSSGVMGAGSGAMAAGSSMASSSMGASGGMTSGMAASPASASSSSAGWSAPGLAEDQEEADLAPTAGQRAQGGLTDDE